MFNAQRPRLDDLPTSRQLTQATTGAVAAAAAILVTVVLPAEYAIDPTGIGRTLGLTQMGEIKQQLAQEAASDRAAVPASASPALSTSEARPAAPTSGSLGTRTDITRVTLAPGEGAEVKVSAAKGATVAFQWTVEGGLVNYDTHGDPVSAPAGFYHGYGKGKQSAGQQGELVAAFDGKHGWFWRNRSDGPVIVILRTEGQYSDIRRVV